MCCVHVLPIYIQYSKVQDETEELRQLEYWWHPHRKKCENKAKTSEFSVLLHSECSVGLFGQRMQSKVTAESDSHRVYNDTMERWMLTCDSWLLVFAKQSERSTLHTPDAHVWLFLRGLELPRKWMQVNYGQSPDESIRLKYICCEMQWGNAHRLINFSWSGPTNTASADGKCT